jgi:hypothetical protein
MIYGSPGQQNAIISSMDENQEEFVLSTIAAIMDDPMVSFIIK